MCEDTSASFPCLPNHLIELSITTMTKSYCSSKFVKSNTNCSSSIGLANKYHWIRWQPNSQSFAYCACVSNLRQPESNWVLYLKQVIALMIARQQLSSLRCITNERSIIKQSSGNSFSLLNEEYPVPKSSNAIAPPLARIFCKVFSNLSACINAVSVNSNCKCCHKLWASKWYCISSNSAGSSNCREDKLTAR